MEPFWLGFLVLSLVAISSQWLLLDHIERHNPDLWHRLGCPTFLSNRSSFEWARLLLFLRSGEFFAAQDKRLFVLSTLTVISTWFWVGAAIYVFLKDL